MERCLSGIRNAASIGAAPHCGDRLFRLRKALTIFPPPAVVSAFPHSLFQRSFGFKSHLYIKQISPPVNGGLICLVSPAGFEPTTF